jgi:hypothetical protein
MKATDAKLLDFLKKSPQFTIPIYQRGSRQHLRIDANGDDGFLADRADGLWRCRYGLVASVRGTGNESVCLGGGFARCNHD